MRYNSVLDVVAMVVTVALVLVPFPAQLAPTQNDVRQARQTVTDREALDAFSGLIITFLYVRTVYTLVN